MMMDDSDDEFVPEAEQPQKPWRPPKEPKEKVLVASQAKLGALVEAVGLEISDDAELVLGTYPDIDMD